MHANPLHFPYSAGSAAAQTVLPWGACDAHLHVYDDQVLPVAGARLRPPPACIEQYRQIQARMGTTRAVLVTPSTYGTNNAPMLQGLAQLGTQGRGVAVISGMESDEELHRLHQAGVRGVRINLSQGVTHQPTDIARMAQRIAPLGWHLQLLMPADQLVAMRLQLQALPVDLVFDHFARISPAHCGKHPAHALMLHWLAEGRAWIKISGGYIVSAQSSVEDPALDALARSFIQAAPHRVLWGSDWPHATASAGLHPMPDDARQIDRLAQWASGAEPLHRILVANPAQLYDFPSHPSD